jgi:hypothetical protein
MFFPRLPLLIILILVGSLPVQHWVLENQTNAAVGAVISEATQAANTTVTKLFVNELYPRLKEPLALEGKGKRGEPLSGEALETTDSTIRRFMFGTDIMKVKIYGMNGMTVYSTERRQIGENKYDNEESDPNAIGFGDRRQQRRRGRAIDAHCQRRAVGRRPALHQRRVLAPGCRRRRQQDRHQQADSGE